MQPGAGVRSKGPRSTWPATHSTLRCTLTAAGVSLAAPSPRPTPGGKAPSPSPERTPAEIRPQRSEGLTGSPSSEVPLPTPTPPAERSVRVLSGVTPDLGDSSAEDGASRLSAGTATRGGQGIPKGL